MALAVRLAVCAFFVWAGGTAAQPLQLRPAEVCVLCDAPPSRAAAPEPAFPLGPADSLRLRPSHECPGCAEAAARLTQPAALEALVTVMINLEPKGERGVLVAADGDVLMREQDLRLLGLGEFVAETTQISGEAFVSLRAARDLKFNFDESRLELDLRIPVAALARRNVLDFSRSSGPRPQPRGAGGLFMNYNFTGNGGEGTGMSDVGMAGEVGAHVLGGLLTTDFLADRNLQTNDSLRRRLSTTLTYDDLERLQRLALGDFVTVPGQLGGSMRLGGISLSRRLALDPYFVRFPGQIVTGTAALPSEVFVYSNGVLIRRERILPGAFELQNLTNLTGLSVTEVVVRDVLGNEQRIVNPFYFTDTLLRGGLDEYSIDAGLERLNFGTTSTDYGSLGLSAFYRRGVTDDLTLGMRGESLRDITNIGPSGTARLGTLGVLGAALGLSSGPSGRAGAWALSHSYTAYRFGTSLAYRREERAYARVGAPVASLRSEVAATANWAAGPTTSMGVGVRRSDEWSGFQTRQWSATVNQRVGRDLTASLVALRTTGTLSSTEIFLTVGYQFGLGNQPASVTAQRHNFTGGSNSSLQLSGGVNEEPGLGYRLQLRTEQRAGSGEESINPALRYNFDRVVTRAEYFRNSGAPGSYQLAAAGAIATVGGYWGLSRPIFDSYGIAKVGELPGVRVYANFQEVGRTDSNGMIFIPRLASYFDNPVSIEQKDLPIEYAVPQVRQGVIPALRSGVFVDFEARRVHAVRGRLIARRDGTGKPFGGALGTVSAEGQQLEMFTSEDGSFYVEVGAGSHTGTAQAESGTCTFRLAVPETTEVVVDLGEVVCDALQ